MASKFLGNPTANNEKTARGTVGHCISMERNLRAKSVKARALADKHRHLAQAAERK
jgi:hypothetical protein